MFGTIDRAVLPAGATKSYLQMGETALDETLYVVVYQFVDSVEKSEYLAILLEEVNDRLV